MGKKEEVQAITNELFRGWFIAFVHFVVAAICFIVWLFVFQCSSVLSVALMVMTIHGLYRFFVGIYRLNQTLTDANRHFPI
jgi:hypothetical protein